jgi:RimJ/RimL family protein N-acetyltransferase
LERRARCRRASPSKGRFCTLEPLDAAKHADDLHAAYAQAPDGRDWTYLGVERPADLKRTRAYIERASQERRPAALRRHRQASGRAVGTLALMRIDPTHGVIEVGSVNLLAAAQADADVHRSPVPADEARLRLPGLPPLRVEVRQLQRALQARGARLGFQAEGVFRQAVVYKGRSRDTAWFSIIEREWPALRTAFERWLAPENFDAQGGQRMALDKFRLPS